MDLMKKIGVWCFLLFVLLPGAAAMPSEAAFDGLQAMEGDMLPRGLKGTEEGAGVIDSTGSYKYIVNEAGAAEIVDCLKEEENVKIPEALDGHPVTVIQTGAFRDCWKLEKLFISKNVEQIDGNIVQDSDRLTRIQVDVRNAFYTSVDGILYNKEMTELLIVPGGKDMAGFQFLDSVVCIGERAFCGNQSAFFTELIIPERITAIGDGNIVEGAKKLTKIEVDARNAVYRSVDGILYNKEMTELLIVPGGKDMAGFQFLDSVVCIGERAFCGNQSASFTELLIPDQITAIGDGAFAYCQNLRKVVIGKNVKKIPDAAFFQSGLSEIEIGTGVQIIGSSAFRGCPLHKITIPDNVTEIREEAFYGCYLLKEIMIPKSVTKMEYWGLGYVEERKERAVRGVMMTGYRGTVAHQYAKKYSLVFRDIETGRNMRFDLALVPIAREKITVLKARKKKIELEYYPGENVAYQIAIKKAGASSWKKYNKAKTWASIRGLKPGRQYQVKVRAWREIDGKYYYGKWSKVKKVMVR